MKKLDKLKYKREQKKACIEQGKLRLKESLDLFNNKKTYINKELENKPELKAFIHSLVNNSTFLFESYKEKEVLDKLISSEAVKNCRDKKKNREHQIAWRERQKAKKQASNLLIQSGITA